MKLSNFFTPRVFRWLVVGFVFSALGLAVIKLLAGVLAWPYAIATFCSGEICTLLRFLVVDRWVFEHRRPTWTRLWQYHVANAAGFGVWWAAANILQTCGVHYILAAVFAMCFSIGFNLLSNFLWIWRKPASTTKSGMNQEPNKALQPTRMSVTPPAGAGAATAKRVADL